ncbi:MAG: hypothetical protein QXT01_03355 [Sulfolobales archaeon]
MRGLTKTSKFVKYVLDSIFIQLDNCITLNAVCRDPPATTSAILRTLGLSEYEIRSFWNIAKRRIRDKLHTITIFKHRNISFKVVVEVRSGSSCFIAPTSFIDEFDCQEFPQARQLTNLNMLYVYVNGYRNDELFIKVNVVYLLKKLVDLGEARTVNSIRKVAEKLITKSFTFDTLPYINDLINTLLRFNRELRELIVYIPKNDADFIRLIPLLSSKA